MFLDQTLPGGGGGYSPSCRACRQPLLKGQQTRRIEFDNDPSGFKGLTGEYHLACSKLYASFAHVINLKPWAGR
jgi:hypothetical protein